MPGQQGDGTTININISLPQGNSAGNSTQPNINVNGLPARETARLPQQNYQQQNQPQPGLNSSYRQLPPRQPGEYQLQNQTGFEQWQQMNSGPVQTQAPVQYMPSSYVPMPHPAQRVYRRTDEIMMHEMGNLPAYCVKCNEDASAYSGGGVVRQKYRWTHPLVYISLVSPLIFVILRLALAKRAKVDLPLCRTHLEGRKTTGNFLVGASVVSAIVVFFLGSAGSVGLAALLFFAALVGITISYEYLFQPLRSSKIDNEFVYLKGASPAYLSRLPYC